MRSVQRFYYNLNNQYMYAVVITFLHASKGSDRSIDVCRKKLGLL